jgi:SPP1 gp7 family putative phage head morphogenesis protein
MTGVPIDDTQDYYLRPFNVVPVESGPAPVSIASDSKELKFSMDEMGKEQHWRMYVLKAENHENRLIDGLQGMFADQQKEALQNFNETYRAVIDAEQAKQDYREIATPVLSSLMASEIEDARNMLNGHKALKQESVLTQAALTWLKTRIGWAAEEVGEQTAELLSLQMAEGYAQGEGIPELTKRVKGVFEFCTIARTETIQAAAQGSIEGYKAEGVGRLEFYAALDERICPDCLALHEQEFPINESTGIITVHPNCRCVWLPVI